MEARRGSDNIRLNASWVENRDITRLGLAEGKAIRNLSVYKSLCLCAMYVQWIRNVDGKTWKVSPHCVWQMLCWSHFCLEIQLNGTVYRLLRVIRNADRCWWKIPLWWILRPMLRSDMMMCMDGCKTSGGILLHLLCFLLMEIVSMIPPRVAFLIMQQSCIEILFLFDLCNTSATACPYPRRCLFFALLCMLIVIFIP